MQKLGLLLSIILLFCLNTYHSISTQFGRHLVCNSDNECKNQHLVAGTDCEIDCIQTSGCKLSKITFSNSCDYSYLRCSKYHSCLRTKIKCAANGYCEIHSQGDRSITDSKIYCPSNAECIIQCQNHESCASTNVICGYNSQCYIQCDDNDNSCVDVVIDAKQAQSVHVICKEKSCINLSLHCPMNNSQCLLELHGNDNYAIGNSVDIYTLNGEIEILNHNQSIHDIKLFCGDQFSSNCAISSLTQKCEDINNICNNNVLKDRTIVTTKEGVDPIADNDGSVNNNVNDNMFTEYYNWITRGTINMIICIIILFLWLLSLIYCCLCCYAAKQKKRLKRNLIDPRNEQINIQNVEVRRKRQGQEREGNCADANSDSDEESQISQFEAIV